MTARMIFLPPLAQRLRPLVPGTLLCIALAAVATGLAQVEHRLFGAAWLEPLVLAILAGAALRLVWTPGAAWRPGIGFSAKVVLEVAVVLLGATVSAATILAVGPALLIGIAAVVALAVAGGFLLARLLGLPARMALLIACGNAICGNSAIAAVAPVIEAESDDVTAAIAFTAILGVAVVLGLPLLGHALGYDALRYGTLAGLTVYAVPQVLAAAAPMGSAAIQIGTLVKLVRVLMLGPVCVVLALLAPALPAEGRSGQGEAPEAHAATAPRRKPGLANLVPWFVLGFLGMVALNSLGLIPAAIEPGIGWAAGMLTVISMAALGLGVDARAVAAAGGRVTLAVTGALALLGLLGLALIGLLAGGL